MPDQIFSSKENPALQKGSLKKILGVSFGIAVTIGGTIGVGILRTPGIVAAQFGSGWLIMAAWVLGGAYALLGTISILELGTMLPQDGGWFVFVRRAFGDYGGFIIGWSDWVGTCASVASMLIAIGEFTIILIPSWAGYIKSIAIVTLLFFFAIQWIGLKASSRTQEITSLVKALAFIALVAACFIYGGGASVLKESAEPVKTPGTFTAIIFAGVIALQSIIFTYDGWYNAVYFSEEDKDPGKNLPKSALGGVFITIAIYLLVNAGFLYVLPLSQLTKSIAPATDTAIALFGSMGGKIITALSIASLLSIVNAVLMVATRVIFALGRDNLFTRKVASVSDSGTPRAALALSTVIVLLLLLSGTFTLLVAISTFFYVANYLTSFIALIVLRKREPDLHRPFRAWGYPWTTLIFITGSLLFLIGAVSEDPRNSIYALVVLALSYPLFLLVKKLNKEALAKN